MAASASKAAGNLAFKQSNYPLALAHYTTAIQQDPSEFTYPLNRALVYLKLEQWKEAEKDANTTLHLMPNHPKALFRRGLARKGKGDWKKAREDFEEAKRNGAGEEVEKELKALEGKGLGDEKRGAGKPPSAPVSAPKVASSSSAPSPTPTPSTTSTSAVPSSSAAEPNPKTKTDRSRLLSALSPPSTSTSKPAPSNSVPTPSSTATSPSPSAKGAAAAATGELMQAVSTRRLTKPQGSPSASAAGKGAAGEEKKVNAFERLKKEREEKSRAAFGAGGGGGAASAVGGEKKGKVVGEGKKDSDTAEQKKEPSPSISTPASAAAAAPNPAPSPPVSLPLLTPPPAAAAPPTATTVTSLELLLSSSPSSTSSAEKLALLQTLPLKYLPTFFSSSLTPDLLSSILGVLLSSHSAPSPSPSEPPEANNAEEELLLLEWTLPFLRALVGVRRFEVCKMFLEEGEKEGIRHLLQRGKEALDRLGKEWDV